MKQGFDPYPRLKVPTAGLIPGYSKQDSSSPYYGREGLKLKRDEVEALLVFLSQLALIGVPRPAFHAAARSRFALTK
jgi:hypothetical protein